MTGCQRWFLNESPLYLRHQAIDKLPDLLEALAKTGETVAGKLTRHGTGRCHRRRGDAESEEVRATMDTSTLLALLAFIAAVVYLGRLVIREGGQFEAGGRSGFHAFFIKTRPRRK